MRSASRSPNPILAILFAGSMVACGGNHGLVAGGPAQPSSISSAILARTPSVAAGGAFTAHYLGGYSSAPCYNGKNGYFNFSGHGSAKFLRKGTESGKMIGKHVVGNFCEWTGSATLASSKHSGDTMTVFFENRSSPCIAGTLQFSVTSGTGKFAHVSGSGKVTFACQSNAYTDRWSGTITF